MFYEVTLLDALLKLRYCDEIVIFAIDLSFSRRACGAGHRKFQIRALLYELFDYGCFAGA
jgi:hypothetical protein